MDYAWLLSAPVEVMADDQKDAVLVRRTEADAPTVLSFRDERLLVDGTDYDFGEDYFCFLGIWDAADSDGWTFIPAGA
jgi:hypothetical protein